MRRVVMSVAAVAAAFALSALPAEAAPALNQKVVKFARSQMGRQVGNGECWTLADRALQYAGAHRPGSGGYAVYVFGKQISRRALQPGDVIQFENVVFQHQSANGSSSNNFPHHTAIVTSVRGTRITLLQQNVNGNRTVQTGVIDMRDFRGGTMRYFRPQPR